MYSRLEEQNDAGNEGLEERAKALLDRVLLMRVFDFVGVVEAVGEIGAGLEEKTGRGGDEGMEGAGGDGNGDDVEETEAGKRSEGERDEETGKGRVGMIIIDSMTNVVSSMMSKDHVQGPSFCPLSPPSISLRLPLPKYNPYTDTLTNNHPLTPQATPS